jgi:hypothetical protein
MIKFQEAGTPWRVYVETDKPNEVRRVIEGAGFAGLQLMEKKKMVRNVTTKEGV